MNSWVLPSSDIYNKWKLPMVEIFETIEGEGSAAGFPTVFVRVFHCNLRCTWCDTPYSYAPAKPEFEATIEEIVHRVRQYSSHRICFTGGEPLIHREKSAALLIEMAKLESIKDIHIETNGAIDIEKFDVLRNQYPFLQDKVRFVIDYKLTASGEKEQMIHRNFSFLKGKDEIKFVIANETDFQEMKDVVESHHQKGQILLSPVWESMPPARLVEMVLAEKLSDVKVSLQLHKVIWDPNKRGV